VTFQWEISPFLDHCLSTYYYGIVLWLHVALLKQTRLLGLSAHLTELLFDIYTHKIQATNELSKCN